MTINKHPMAQVSRKLDVILPSDRQLKVLARFHENGNEFVTNLRNDLCVVDCGKLMLSNHVFVQD